MKKYTTRIIAEVKTNLLILQALIKNKSLLDNANMFLQDIINDESVMQADLVITDYSRTSNDVLITDILAITGADIIIDVIEFVETISEASDDGIDNILIYTD